MIDLSYRKPDVETNDEIIHPFVAKIGLVLFSAFLAIVVLSSIAGQPLM